MKGYEVSAHEGCAASGHKGYTVSSGLKGLYGVWVMKDTWRPGAGPADKGAGGSPTCCTKTVESCAYSTLNMIVVPQICRGGAVQGLADSSAAHSPAVGSRLSRQFKHSSPQHADSLLCQEGGVPPMGRGTGG